MWSGAGETVHATCVAIDGAGVLLLGPPGSGKSDLALRLICDRSGHLPEKVEDGPILVSDDRVLLRAEGGDVRASPPDTIAGRLEVRGVGVLSLPYVPDVAVALAVELVPPDQVPRIPDRRPVALTKDGASVPLIHLAPFEASAPAKLIMAVRGVLNGNFAEDIDEASRLPDPASGKVL